MTPEGLALAATIILIGPMLYFLIASPTFLLRPLSDPTVTWLLRGLFSVCFSAVAGTCGLAALAFALAGRPPVALGIIIVATIALGARHWFLRRMDAEMCARDGGDAQAPRRLRRLHWGGMAFNLTQLGAILAGIPRMFPGI